jgi:hypothetical protein
MWLVQEQEWRVNIPGMVPFSVEGERSELKKTKTSSDFITQFAIKKARAVGILVIRRIQVRNIK